GATRTRPRATSSSSAATCASAVQTPWPYSTLPERTVTVPSAANSIQCARLGLAARDAGRERSGPVAGWAGALIRARRSVADRRRRAEHGVDNAAVRTAPAQVALKRLAYLVLVW